MGTLSSLYRTLAQNLSFYLVGALMLAIILGPCMVAYSQGIQPLSAEWISEQITANQYRNH